MTLPKALISDLDGVLCDHSHRLHHVDVRFADKTGWTNESIPISECPYGHAMTENVWKDKNGKKWKPDWDAFYAGIPNDGVNFWCRLIITEVVMAQYQDYECKVLFVTARPEKCRPQTEAWISNHNMACVLQRKKLFMRPDFLPIHLKMGKPTQGIIENEKNHLVRKPDHRPAHEVKREIYKKEIAGKYDVLFVLEDDERCAEMYRSLGLTVLLCK